MKKIINLILSGIAIISINSCTDDDLLVFTAQDVDGPSIVTANSTVTLNSDIEEDQAFTLVWNDANYNANTPVTYKIEAAAAGTDFAALELAATTTERSFTWTVSQLNNLAITLGLNVDEEGAVEMRVNSSVGTNDGLTMTSGNIILTVVPYSTETPKLWLPGNYAASSGYGSNWNPSDPETPFLQAESFSVPNYEGYVYFTGPYNDGDPSPQFKMTPTNANFDGDYGDTGDNNGDFSGTIEQDGDVNAGTPGGEAGYYKINVNLEALTYTMVATQWAITGAATPNGWPDDADPVGTADQDMTYDPAAKVWYIDIDLTAGEFKFRANDAWTLNYGPDDDGDGSLNEGGGNFSVDAAGNYRVTLDFSNPRAYTASIIQN